MYTLKMRVCSDKERVRKFLILAVLGLLLVNIPLISAYIVMIKFGTLKLNPGEKYTVNIPFLGSSKAPMISGVAEQTDGTLLAGVNVSIKYKDNSTLIARNTTGKDGKFRITLPEIKTYKYFDVYVEYDNSTLTLGSNDYDLNFDNNLVFNKNVDRYAYLRGSIVNNDARIENGRVEVNLQYYPINVSDRFEVFDYQTYYVNMDSGEDYKVPSSELNVSWPIDLSTLNGRYKFYIKTSFNAKERIKDIYFNVTG